MAPETDDAVEWLDDDEMQSWMAVVAMLGALPSALDGQLKRDVGVNHFEYSILAGLSASPDHTLAMSDLAGVVFGSLSRLSHAVGRLEKRGWVVRCGTEAGRHQATRLTDLGRAELEVGAPSHVREVRRLLIDPLTSEEFHQLGEISRKVLDAVDPKRAADIRRLFH